VANPRRLYRPGDVAWQHSAEPDGGSWTMRRFAELFDGDALIAVSGGGTVALEPVLLRSRGPRPRPVRLAARRDHREPGGDHGLQRDHRRDALAQRAQAMI
jgi:hypothetical protein